MSGFPGSSCREAESTFLRRLRGAAKARRAEAAIRWCRASGYDNLSSRGEQQRCILASWLKSLLTWKTAGRTRIAGIIRHQLFGARRLASFFTPFDFDIYLQI